MFLDKDGRYKPAESAHVQSVQARGVVLPISTSSSARITLTPHDTIEVLIAGEITGYSGLIPGHVVYISASPGRLTQDLDDIPSGHFAYIIGWADSDGTTLIVQPQITIPTAK